VNSTTDRPHAARHLTHSPVQCTPENRTKHLAVPTVISANQTTIALHPFAFQSIIILFYPWAYLEGPWGPPSPPIAQAQNFFALFNSLI